MDANLLRASPDGDREDSPALIERYLVEVSAIPRLLPEEESRLLQSARQGDRAARKSLVQANLAMVVEVASLYRGRGVRFLDLVQEGNVALLSAIDAADVPSTGFTAFARPLVEKAIAASLTVGAGETSMPAELVTFIALVRQARANLTARLNRPPKEDEVARHLNLSLAQFLGLQRQVEEYLGMGQGELPQSR